MTTYYVVYEPKNSKSVFSQITGPISASVWGTVEAAETALALNDKLQLAELRAARDMREEICIVFIEIEVYKGKVRKDQVQAQCDFHKYLKPVLVTGHGEHIPALDRSDLALTMKDDERSACVQQSYRYVITALNQPTCILDTICYLPYERNKYVKKRVNPLPGGPVSDMSKYYLVYRECSDYTQHNIFIACCDNLESAQSMRLQYITDNPDPPQDQSYMKVSLVDDVCIMCIESESRPHDGWLTVIFYECDGMGQVCILPQYIVSVPEDIDDLMLRENNENSIIQYVYIEFPLNKYFPEALDNREYIAPESPDTPDSPDCGPLYGDFTVS